eukprot:TRINITY_DN5851_c0_g2_i1.p2 TRINITY_DN5851_c0_g2~~TRINITY_DN5851_c0_g2_i1.p2  ORF type:complete len:125 (+),score=34.05 TRINITY_DN5851_c0_g2_i1:249-623(+)
MSDNEQQQTIEFESNELSGEEGNNNNNPINEVIGVTEEIKAFVKSVSFTNHSDTSFNAHIFIETLDGEKFTIQMTERGFQVISPRILSGAHGETLTGLLQEISPSFAEQYYAQLELKLRNLRRD